MQSTTLANGLRVLVQPSHTAPVVAIQVWVKVGSKDEVGPEAGLAHVHEHMLFKGTARRKVGEIAAEIEGAGGDINAWTSYDHTVYHVTMASRDFPVGLDILSDAVQHSSFDPDELTKELEVVLEELRRGNDQPSRVVTENLFGTAFTQHPYKRPIIGTVESVKGFTREMILDFYRKWYRPENMCLVVVGDVDPADVLRRAERMFVRPTSGVTPPHGHAPEPRQEGRRFVRVAQAVEETQLALAWHGTPFRHPDTAALDLLSIVLGSGDSSRLFRAVRREKELVNDVSAWSYTPEDAGLVAVSASIHGEGLEPAYRALLEETLRLRYAPVTQAELDKAKTIVLSEAVYSKETVQGIARKLGFYEVSAGGAEYEAQYFGDIRRATVEDLQRVAQVYLRPDAFTVSTVLPEALKDALADARLAAVADEVVAALDAEHVKVTVTPGDDRVVLTTLPNGARVIVQEDHTVPLVSIRAMAKGGLLGEDARTNGVSHLLAETITRGTKRFSAEHIAERTDATAGAVSGSAGRNSVGLRGDFLAEFLPEGLDLFLSCLLEPTFDAREVERERKTQLEDIAGRRDNLSTVAFDQLASTMWSTHPYRLPTVGTKASVEALGAQDVEAAYRRFFRPDALTISVVGAVSAGAILDRLASTVGAVEPGADAPRFVEPPREAAPSEARRVRSARPKEQAHVAIGFPGLDLFDDRRWSLEVLCSVLGGQGGRLFLELRDKLSLCYSVSAFSVEGLHPGYFAVYMGTAQEKLEQAEAGLRRELVKCVEAEISDEELRRAQRYLVGTHAVGLQRASARAGTMSLNALYGLGHDLDRRYPAMIEAVTPASVRRVAREVLRFDRVVRSVVEVGPEES